MFVKPSCVSENHPLSQLTTFEIGGIARYLAEPDDISTIREVLSWTRQEGLPVYPLGGGSNILANDAPYDGVILRPTNCAIHRTASEHGTVTVSAQAGCVWDELVAYCVSNNLAGIECLSGIPGRVGASPIQNIGAYGQEVSQTISSVTVMDIKTGTLTTLSNAECQFSYRDSIFKSSHKGQYLVVEVSFRLIPNGLPTLRYRDLQVHFTDHSSPTLAETRQAVLQIRRSKSMLYEPSNPNRRCAGSFFLNPILPEGKIQELLRMYPDMPTYPSATNTRKVSAAWLISHSGLHKGYQLGRAKLSEQHILCLVNSGGATSREILALAELVQERVHQTFGIHLVAEPNKIGDL